MGEASRPTTYSKRGATLSSSSNVTAPTDGYGGMLVYVTAVSATPVCTVEALLNGGTTWEKINCWQRDVATFTKTARAANTSIILVARDILYINCEGYQQVRLLYSSGTSATVDVILCGDVTGDVVDQLAITLASLPAGTNTIGKVGSPADVISFTPTMDTSAYTAGDIWFDTVSVSGAVASTTGSGTLMSITINDKDDQTAADCWIVVLNAAQSLGTVNVAPSISDANADKILGWVKILSSDWLDFGGCKVAHKANINMPIEAAGTTVIGVAGITNGTPTQTASGLTVTLGILQNG